MALSHPIDNIIELNKFESICSQTNLVLDELIPDQLPKEQLPNIKPYDEPLFFKSRNLLLNCIHFLVNYGSLSNLVVYLGAAPGFHLPILSHMFPKHHFILIDYDKFKIPPISNVNIIYIDSEYQKFDQISILLKNKNCLFISYLRKAIGDNQNQDRLLSDNLRQIRWVELMKPIAAMLQFTCLSNFNETVMFNGQIYLHPWSEINDINTSLVTLKPYSLKSYLSRKYFNQLTYFNNIVRQSPSACHPSSYDECMEIVILGQYLNQYRDSRKTTLFDDIASLSTQIIESIKENQKTDVTKLDHRRKSIIKVFGNLSIDPIDMLTLENIPLQIPYMDMKMKHRSYHIGQYKLLTSELAFLNRYAPLKDQFVVVYAGSAPGHHIPYLCHLFSNMRMILVDPAPHYLMNNTNIVSSFDVIKDTLYFKFSDRRKKHNNPIGAPSVGTLFVSNDSSKNKILKIEELEGMKQLKLAFLPTNPQKITGEQRIKCANKVVEQINQDLQDPHNTRRLYIIEDYFTNEYAERFGQMRSQSTTILFMSDIRTILNTFLKPAELANRHKYLKGQEKSLIEKEMETEDDETRVSDLDIIVNNAQQHIWMKMLKPNAGLLKFRCPFHNEIDEYDVKRYWNKINFYKEIIDQYKELFKHDLIQDYFDNDSHKETKYYSWMRISQINLQSFQDSSSTETRAIVSSEVVDQQLIKINYKEYESRLCAYNVMREFVFYERNRQYFDEQIGIDGCPDCNILLNAFKTYRLRNAEQPDPNLLNPDTIKKLISQSLIVINRSLIPSGSEKNFYEHGSFVKPLTLEEALQINEDMMLSGYSKTHYYDPIKLLTKLIKDLGV